MTPKSLLLQDCPIWITGMGAVSSAGLSADALWDAALEGRCNRSWQSFGEKHRYITAQAPDIVDLVDAEKALKKLDRTGQLAGLAVKEAMNQAELKSGHEESGVIFGSNRGAVAKYLEAVGSIEHKRMRPLLAATSTMASISGSIANCWDVSGPTMTVSSACASAAHAVAIGAEKILLGDAEMVIAGGVESCLHPSVLGALDAAGVFGFHENDRLVCRPFDRDRNGMFLGEGAGCLILENAASAQRRGVKPLAKLSGWSIGSDSEERTGVSENGAAILDMMRAATEIAQISAEQVSYINAHGTGTRMNDLAEANAINKFQLDSRATIPVSSTKPITGHCLGATPALEAIMTIKSMHAGILPATVGCLSQDPNCAIDVITDQPRGADTKYALSNSLGFWGHMATLLFEK